MNVGRSDGRITHVVGPRPLTSVFRISPDDGEKLAAFSMHETDRPFSAVYLTGKMSSFSRHLSESAKHQSNLYHLTCQFYLVFTLNCTMLQKGPQLNRKF